MRLWGVDLSSYPVSWMMPGVLQVLFLPASCCQRGHSKVQTWASPCYSIAETTSSGSLLPSASLAGRASVSARSPPPVLCAPVQRPLQIPSPMPFGCSVLSENFLDGFPVKPLLAAQSITLLSVLLQLHANLFYFLSFPSAPQGWRLRCISVLSSLPSSWHLERAPWIQADWIKIRDTLWQVLPQGVSICRAPRPLCELTLESHQRWHVYSLITVLWGSAT